ncbi:hypothetical protein [Roseibium litorale]|uniref:Uncharacterized protein n=1 Tax=Roseibium litorale TaxID=2803841 RepID=A0ABR9CIF1_9HYPH|nr:hypothetical protein [Roseibium litorale]MBD8890616.1 hypothetical protein [Roseibium litorale]
MAKGQKRKTKEIRKPKQDKSNVKTETEARGFLNAIDPSQIRGKDAKRK